MFDAKALLNSVLGAQGATAVTEVLEDARSAVSGAADRAQAGLAGTKAGDAFGRARHYARENPGTTLAGAGALAALLLGTGAGRRVGGTALQAGGLAAVGGLAYKAFTNWQGGKPLLEGVPGLQDITAPAGSGFHADDQTQHGARTILLAVIATAAADGVVDPAERARITDALKKAGLESEAAGFLDAAAANPATPAQIAAAVAGDQKLAVQVYATASVVSAPDNAPARDYLARLASALGLSPDLVAHLDAASLSTGCHGER